MDRLAFNFSIHPLSLLFDNSIRVLQNTSNCHFEAQREICIQYDKRFLVVPKLQLKKEGKSGLLKMDRIIRILQKPNNSITVNI